MGVLPEVVKVVHQYLMSFDNSKLTNMDGQMAGPDWSLVNGVFISDTI